MRSFSTSSLDYLLGLSRALPDLKGEKTVTCPATGTRRLERARGIGVWSKQPPAQALPIMDVPPTRDVIVGLYGHKVPLAFVVTGTTQGVDIRLGNWDPDPFVAGGDVVEKRADLLRVLLDGGFAQLDTERADLPSRRWERSALVVGNPSVGAFLQQEFLFPIDRVTRALAALEWSFTVIAQPVDEQVISRLRYQIIEEIRKAETAAQSSRAPSPLLEHYVEQLTHYMRTLVEGHSIGAWRTAVYLQGTDESYPHLAGVWKAVFEGEASKPESIKVFELPEAQRFAERWEMPDVRGAPGPSNYQRLFECQTLLTSKQLAAYVHFPTQETLGFSISLLPHFDAVAKRRRVQEGGISIGRVINRSRLTASRYAVSPGALSRHLFVGGVTGSGKTNTVFHLLDQLAKWKIPFLVLEPAKTEYRGIGSLPSLMGDLQVFTPGNETVSPIRLNPFEVLPGTGIGTHIDLLRSVFAASFGMWTPLPQVLERCLYEVYWDRGWDIGADENWRLAEQGNREMSFPTMTDLYNKVEAVIRKLGYNDEVTSNLRAALSTRLAALRIGSKGRMLDVQYSSESNVLFSSPVVLELEHLGDDDDKAFVMGLVLIRLAEYRRQKGQSADLQHLLIVEEAHRLLKRGASSSDPLQADPTRKAVDTFTNLLAEIRAYGQGVLVADQVPVRLAPEVLKNTGTKIIHRLVALDDRVAVGETMGMQENQMRSLSTLDPGQAAVFGDGDDLPILVQVPLVKDVTESPNDHEIESLAMKRRQRRIAEPSEVSYGVGSETHESTRILDRARELLDDVTVTRTVVRVVLSLLEDVESLDRGWDELMLVLRARRLPWLEERSLFAAFFAEAARWIGQHRGAQGGWSFKDTERFCSLLTEVLTEKARAPVNRAQLLKREALQSLAHRLYRRTFEPFPACASVCGSNEPSLCLYRYWVDDLVRSGRYQKFWKDADARDQKGEKPTRKSTWSLAESAAYELIEYPKRDWSDEARQRENEAIWRVKMCFCQQMLSADRRKHPRAVEELVEQTLRQSGK